MASSAATACSARDSCTNPSTALATTMAAITIASNGQPSAPSRTQARAETAMAKKSR